MSGFREKGFPAGWTELRTTAVEAAETLGTTAEILAETWVNQGSPFVDLFCVGTLAAANSLNITMLEVNTEEDGSKQAYPVKHAFKDGSTTITVDEECIIPMVTARGEVAVVFTSEVGAASVKVWIRNC